MSLLHRAKARNHVPRGVIRALRRVRAPDASVQLHVNYCLHVHGMRLRIFAYDYTIMHAI